MPTLSQFFKRKNRWDREFSLTFVRHVDRIDDLCKEQEQRCGSKTEPLVFQLDVQTFWRSIARIQVFTKIMSEKTGFGA